MSDKVNPEEILAFLRRKPNPTREQALADIEKYCTELCLLYEQRLTMMRLAEGTSCRAPFNRKEVIEWSERAETLASFYSLKSPPYVAILDVMSSEEAGRALREIREWLKEQVNALTVPTPTAPAQDTGQLAESGPQEACDGDSDAGADPFLTSADLAKLVGISTKAASTFLSRFQKKHPACAMKAPKGSATTKKAKYLYRKSAVLPALQEYARRNPQECGRRAGQKKTA